MAQMSGAVPHGWREKMCHVLPVQVQFSFGFSHIHLASIYDCLWPADVEHLLGQLGAPHCCDARRNSRR